MGKAERSAAAAENVCSVSTTFEWKRVRVSRPPEANSRERRKAPRWFGRPPWNRRDPITLKISYRGGAECWIEVHARGSVGRYPGHTQVIDLMKDIWQDG
jgi:hypothetical protein